MVKFPGPVVSVTGCRVSRCNRAAKPPMIAWSRASCSGDSEAPASIVIVTGRSQRCNLLAVASATSCPSRSAYSA